LISNKNTFTKHKKQDTHWAAYNSETAHQRYIHDEDSLKWKCKNNDDRSADKELHTELVAVRKSQDTETELFCEVVRSIFSN